LHWLKPLFEITNRDLKDGAQPPPLSSGWSKNRATTFVRASLNPTQRMFTPHIRRQFFLERCNFVIAHR